MAERPLYTLYKNLKAQNYDVPDDYNKFESALTRDGKGGADNRHAIYENLKAQNFDVPSTYERFYSALFEPRSRTSSRAKGGSVPMSAADRARFSAGAAAISASAQHTMNNAGRYNRLKQRKQKQQKDFGRVNLGTHQTPYGGDANNVVKDDFAYNPETGKTGAYVTSDNENVYSLPEAEQMQAILDKQNDAYQVAVDTGEIPSAFDVRDKNGNYDLQENIGKNGTYLTEEGAQKQFDKKLADAYARKKEIEALIAEDNRQHGNPLLSYGASIGASNGRTAEQSDYRNKLATSLAMVTQQIGALEAVKQYPTSSWGEDALKALDNTAFTAKTWDFGLTDFAIMGQMERIKTKMDNNIPLSGSDKMLLKSKLGADAATALEDEKMGNVYRWTKIAGQSLPFMADFFLTGGYGGITKGISRGALKFAAKRGMGKVGAAILKNTGIVAGDVIGSYAMAGTEQALKTGADIMQRHLGNLYQDEKGDYKFGTFDENGNLLHEGGESIGTALYKGMTSAMVENYTEKLFGHNYGIKKGAVNFMEKHGMNASAEFFKNIGKSGWYTNSKKWMEKFGINGFAEEVMEEEIGIPLHALLDGEGKVSDLLDAKQQLDIIGGMAISVGSMYAMGAGSRPVKGIYNRAQYYRFRNKVNVADSDAQNLMGDNWADIKDKIDNATNEQMGGVLADILRQRDTMTKEQINAAVNYGVNLMKMRGYNVAKTAEMNAKEITNEPTTPEEQHQTDIDNAYSEGHDADDADKHDIQIQQEDQMKTLAAALGISEQQLSAMSDEELESLTGQDDKLDQAIYDYQLSSARYQGVVDDAQDKVDLAAHQAEQRVDMYTDQSRGSVRNATIKASGGLEDYGVYIISGNIATHDDGSIDVSNRDDMILYYDPTTNSVEHADALMFAELGEELPADDVKAQAVADAKENAIKEVAGIIDGTVEVGSQFKVTGADGMEHTYEVLADYGDGTAAISIDGNVVENPYSLADLQQMKDLEDQKRLEAAKAEREQMEKERAAQQNQETEETQPSFDFNQILNDNGNVVLVDVLDKDGNTKYPDSRLFLIRDAGAKAKVVELKSDGTLVPHAVNKEDVATISSMSLDEYKQAMPESGIIEDNSGEESDEDSQLANLGLPKGSEIWMSGDGFGRPKENTQSKVVGIDEQGSIILEDKDGKKWSASFDYINNHRELPPLDENTNIVNEENNQSESNAEENTPTPQQTPAITLEDGTIVPMLEDGNPDFSKLTAAQTAELYDTQFGEDADSIVSGYVSDAKKALDKASNMTVKGKTFVEQKAAKDAKEKAIADAQAAYDSAIAIRDAYNERQLAKVEDTADGRKALIEKARRKFARLKSAVKDDAESVSQLYRETIGSLLHRLYDSTGIDVTDTTPLTAEEYVASNLGAHSLNYEGTETSKGVKQETGLSREDFAKTQLLAADGKGTTIDALVHSLWENRPSNLESLDTQDIRNALIGVLNSGFKASEARNFVENIRIAQAENILEEQKRAQENAAYAEQHKAEPEAELKAKSDEKAELKAKSEAKLDNESSNESNDLDNDLDNEKKNDNINDNINTLTPEQQKAKEDGEKLGFPAVDNEGEPINQYVIELANWAKEQGLEIDPASKSNSYADLFLMCKDGFGVSTLVPDEGENINQVVYFPDNVQDFDQLWKLQEEFNAGRDLKHSSNIDSEITEGATFYDADTAREFKEFVDKKVEEQNKVFGEQKSEEDLPFSAKENGKQQTTAERAADVEKNKVYDMKVVDNIVGQKTRKAFERLAKMMGANIQWQYSDKLGNGWIQETTDADGNVHRTIFITLDSSITEGAQFIFGHEMTHQIKNLNPAAYNELTQLVLDTYGSDAFDKAVDETMKRYSDAGFSGRARDYYAEEVVADAVGEMIRDLNLAHTLAMKMSHPLLAAIHEILQKIKLAFFGTEFSDVTKNIIRSIEQAYVKTSKGEVTNSETGEDVSFSLRQKPEPKKKGIGYKVFVLKDGKLYPPMVANPDGAATPVGVWLDADAAPIAGESKTGRPQVKQGGKGTQGGSGKLAYRPGWHLGVVPYAIQFNRKDAEGNKTLFPKNFVFAEVEYAADVDYQEEARQEGINPSGKYQHSLAGLKHLPTDGYYMYRTNPNPETDPWVITGAMKVNRILTRAEQADLVSKAGREPQQIQDGDIVTDDVVNSINQEIADAPKFSLKDNQGNPLNQDGTLKLDKIKSVDELTDEDFTSAFRNVELPAIPKNVDAAIGANGKPVVIKKNIFEKNWNAHKFTPAESKKVLNDALYNTDLVGHTPPTKKPNHWVAIKLDDKSPITVLEVNDNKNNVEVVGWYTLDERNLGRIKRQAERNGGELIMLTPKDDKVESLSTPPLSSAAKIDNSFETAKENGEKVDVDAPKTFDEFLNHPSLKFSIKNEEQRKADEDAYEYASKLRPNKSSQYALVDMNNPSSSPEYYEKKVLADRWRRFYNKAVHNELDDVYKDAWGNYKLFDLDRPFADQVNEVKGDVPNEFNAPDVVANKNADNESGAEYHEYKQDEPSSITYKDRYKAFKQRVANREKTAELRKERKEVEDSYNSKSEQRFAYNKQLMKEYMDKHGLSSENDIPYDVWEDLRSKSFEKYQDELDSLFNKYKDLDKQIKAVAEPRFSLKEEKTLAGVHNISEEKLLKAIKQGGLANPSVAVIDSSRQDHKAYGGISLIMPSDKIAKRTGKNAGTWQGDAYTPTYPQVERQMSNKGAEKASKDVSSVPSDMYSEVRRGLDRWLDGGEANSAMAYMFLHEKGVAPEPKKIQPKFSDEAYNELKFITAGDFNIYGIGKADAQKVLDMYIEAKFDGDKALYEEKTKAWLERNKAIVDAVTKGGMRYAIAKENVELYDEYGFNYKGVQSFVRDVEYDHRKSGVDTNAMLNDVEDYIKTNNLTDEFNTWLEGKEKEYGIKEVIFDGFTPSGNRRYVPNTLENVSKLMKKQGRNGATGAAVSFQNFAARLMPSYGTLKDIRSKKGLLTSDREKFDKFRDKWSNVFFELGNKCQPDSTSAFDSYGMERLSEAAMTSDPQAYLKKEYNVDFSDADTKRLKEMVKAIKEEHPAMYFETKFERPVRFDEFSAAVVPTTTKKEVKEALKNAGVSIFEYDEKSDADRKRAFNEAINSSDNIRFSLRYDKFEHDLNQWKKDNNLPKDAQRPTIPQRNAGESAVDFLRRVDEYRKQMALWKTAPTYEQHLLSDDTALGEFNRELQRGSVLKRIAFQDSMLAIRKAQEAIMKEVGVDRLNMAEDAYTAENRSHGKGKNEFEEYNNEFLQPLRKAYHQMKKILGDSYDNVRIYMMAKHGLERDAQMAFKKSLEADYEDVAQRSAAYKAYKGDMNRIINDSDLEFGRVDFTTWRQRDNALRVKYSPSYMDYRYDKNGIAYDYSGLSALFGGSDFEEAAHKLVKDIESKYVAETHDLWDATNAATKKILRDGYKAGMMSKDTYQYVRDMYSHYIPLRGWDGTTADQVWDYIGGGKGAFNQTLKTAHGRTSIADDPIAYIENMAESGILLNNKNWVKQHLMILAQNHPTSLLTLSKAWYVKSVDDNGNEEWIPATPQITSQMDSNQVKAAIDAFEKKMEKMAQTGDATQKRDGLNIAYPQTHSEEREHEVRVMKDGEEYVIYVNGDPQLAQAMNNTRAHRVREIQSGKLDRAAAWLGRKMAAAYTSLSPLFIPSNYFRDLTMTLASTAIREDAKYNYLLRKNLATSWNLGFMLRDYQNGKLREKVSNGNATPKEQMFYDFMMNGGETGFVSSLDVEDLKKKFKNDLKDLDRWKVNPVKVGHTIMDSIEFLNRMIEDSNRFAVYMTSIQYGRSIDEAVNDAKDVTLNFNRKGTGEYGWQMVRNLYLFINPAVQSLQTLGALAKHHPFKFTAVTASWLASGVLVPVVNAALMSLLGGDDDKDKYWQFTKWDRRNNFIMWVPTTHEFVKIPLAQEFRAFYGVGDMIASKMMGGELAEESWSQYAEDLLGQVVDMLPLDPTGYDGNIAVSLMPNAIRPVFELAFNVDFTGKPLFKETEYNKYDPNFTKAYVGTPDWLVRVSRMMNSIGNDYPDVQQNKWDALGNPRYNLNNPAVVDHVLSSYLGGAYTMGSQVLGVLTKSLNDPKEIKVADIPLFSKFVSNPDDRPVTKKQGDEFWDMKENHDRAANTLSKLKKQAKVDGDYSLLERFYGSEEYKQYKQDDVKVKKYEEDKKKERAEESGEEYRPHKLNAEDIYKAHATPKDDFEDLKLKQLYTKLNGFKSAYDLLVDTAPSQSDSYYNTNKAAIDAIDEISLDKQEISELKKGFLDDGKDAYNAEDMKQIRELRKKILSVLEKANKVVAATMVAVASV